MLEGMTFQIKLDFLLFGDIKIILQIIQRSDLKNMDFQKLEHYGTMK